MFQLSKPGNRCIYELLVRRSTRSIGTDGLEAQATPHNKERRGIREEERGRSTVLREGTSLRADSVSETRDVKAFALLFTVAFSCTAVASSQAANFLFRG